MAKSKLIAANKKIEDGVVGGFTKMTDHFVDQYLTKDNETVEEAKVRLAMEKREKEGKRK